MSLLEIMKRFTASNCCDLFTILGQYTQIASLGPPHEEIDAGTLNRLSFQIVLPILYLAGELDLVASRDSAADLNEELKHPPVTNSELLWKLDAIRKLVEHEMKRKFVLSIPDDLVKYYKADRPLGDAVYDAFPSSRFDLTQAGSCLACGNNIASAFHLMRVSEIGLRELGRDRQIPASEERKD